MTKWTSLAALALTCALAARAPADLVTNGGFESGDFAPGWVATDAASGSDYFVEFGIGHTGDYAALFAGSDPAFTDSIRQDLATAAGTLYVVDFWLLTSVDANGDQNEFSALVDGVTLFSRVDAAPSPYLEFSFTFLATGPSTSLEFRANNIPDETYLDDVSVAPLAVPEPSSLAMIGVGLAVAGGFARGRRRARGVA